MRLQSADQTERKVLMENYKIRNALWKLGNKVPTKRKQYLHMCEVYQESETFGKSYSGESKYDTVDCRGVCECAHV